MPFRRPGVQGVAGRAWERTRKRTKGHQHQARGQAPRLGCRALADGRGPASFDRGDRRVQFQA